MPRKESTKDDKKCGKCGASMHPGNNPGWYTKEGLQNMVGANFAALASVNDMQIGSNKLRTNTGIQFRTLIGCPSDANGSFMKMMNQMYAEIREKNAGAANYTPRILSAYVHELMTLRALYAYACRALAATRSSQAGNGDSPYYLAGVATPYDYSEMSQNLANFANALRLIGKDMSTLPIPAISMFEREQFLYGRIFADSKTSKAAMMAFVPKVYVTRINISEGGSFDYGVVQHNMPNSFSNLIKEMQAILAKLCSNPTIAILRGDLIKAYGYSGADMSSMVDAPLTVEYNATVLSQIENMNPLFADITVTEQYDDFTSIYDGNFVITPTNPTSIAQRAYDTSWMINFHDGMVPDGGTLLSITRNMAMVDTSGVVRSSGDVVIDMTMITGVNASDQTVTSLVLTSVLNSIQSTTQTTAENALRQIANLASIVDGFPWIWTGTGDERTKYAYIWDVDQWAVINDTQLEQMHEQCIRSLFYYRAPRLDGMIKAGRL